MLRLKCMLLAASLLFPAGDLMWSRDGGEILLPILMYHEIRTWDPGKDVILPEEMESDLRYLARKGYTTVLMQDVLAYVYSGAPLPEKPILLTFDDGYAEACTRLYPLLRKYGAKAVICVIGRSTDEFSLLPEDGGPYVHAVWKQLLEMRESGLVELQNHSFDLHRNDGRDLGCRQRQGEGSVRYELRIRSDLDRLQEELYRLTGSAASTFAYPYGIYDEALEGLMEELGFQATLTCDFGVNRLTRDPSCLRGMKRICRSHGADLEALLAHAAAVGAA